MMTHAAPAQAVLRALPREAWLLGLLILAALPAAATELRNPPELNTASGSLTLSLQTLNMVNADGTTVAVRTRSFAPSASAPLVGPTLRTAPSATISLSFTNSLDYDATTGGDQSFSTTTPHGFDVINLHSHGLHVGPGYALLPAAAIAFSDDVLLSIYPQSTPQAVIERCRAEIGDPNLCQQGTVGYRIQVPAGHPAGSFWYHPHKHGAVALHLASGLAGALIVEDRTNGIDSLPAVAAAAEKILVIQQISYGTDASGSNAVTCASTYGAAQCPGSPPSPTTTNSAFSVNGQFAPTISMGTNEAQLWRVVNATPASLVPVCLIRVAGGTAPPQLFVLAADGIPIQRPSGPSPDLPFRLRAPVGNFVGANGGFTPTAGLDIVNNELAFLAAGQRLDLMVQAPSVPGAYQLIGSPSNVTEIGQLCRSPVAANDPTLIATVVVTPPVGAPSYNTALPTQAQLNGLSRPASLTSANPPAAPTQGVTFGFTNVEFAPPAAGGAGVINGRPFTEERIQRLLQLGQLDRWSAMSASDTHVFHIHTNAFQVVQRGQVPYAFPVWRDTLLVNCPYGMGPRSCSFPWALTNASSGTPLTSGVTLPGAAGANGEVVQFLSMALDYTGDMVLHCHNVFHEDTGMMELVSIVDRHERPSLEALTVPRHMRGAPPLPARGHRH
jgi:L-ascorbate oxidase